MSDGLYIPPSAKAAAGQGLDIDLSGDQHPRPLKLCPRFSNSSLLMVEARDQQGRTIGTQEAPKLIPALCHAKCKLFRPDADLRPGEPIRGRCVDEVAADEAEQTNALLRELLAKLAPVGENAGQEDKP